MRAVCPTYQSRRLPHAVGGHGVIVVIAHVGAVMLGVVAQRDSGGETVAGRSIAEPATAAHAQVNR